ncbi:MAG TPA: response regulator [Burkholderiaceae bacterium]|nr:response regulator [Burkholderiaceae bacterium]
MASIYLIVDSDRFSRLVLQGFYEYLRPDWQVFHAASSEEALLIAASTKLDLVSIDFNMQGLNGIAAAMALRQVQPDARIAVLTAHSQATLQSRWRCSGMRFVYKPITLASAREIASLAENAHGQA